MGKSRGITYSKQESKTSVVQSFVEQTLVVQILRGTNLRGTVLRGTNLRGKTCVVRSSKQKENLCGTSKKG